MPRLRLPQFRFTLRTFLILCVLPAPLLVWLASVKIEAVRQRAAVTYLKGRGFEILKTQAPTPAWSTNLVRKYVDHEAFNQVVDVTRFGKDDVTSDDISTLLRLNGLRDLRLARGNIFHGGTQYVQTHVARDDIRRLAGIRSLAGISVDGDADVETQLALARLPELYSLQLPCAKFTNEVLAILGKRPKLSALEFAADEISAEGLSCLRDAPMLQTLSLIRLRKERGILAGLLDCEALRYLKLHRSRIRIEDAETINGLRIQSLTLVDCEIDRGFFKKLSDSQTLKRLGVSGYTSGYVQRDLSLVSLEYCEDHFAKADPEATSSPSSKTP